MKAKVLCTIFFVAILAALTSASFLQNDEAIDKAQLCVVFEEESIPDDIDHSQVAGFQLFLESAESTFNLRALICDFNTTPQTPDFTRRSILRL